MNRLERTATDYRRRSDRSADDVSREIFSSGRFAWRPAHASGEPLTGELASSRS